MNRRDAEEILREALQLSERERARVAAELLASLDPDIETRDGDAWIAEAERRAHAAINGVSVVFLVRPDEISVLAVAHAKRRPGYWLSRVRP